jgi:hypothetical protein
MLIYNAGTNGHGGTQKRIVVGHCADWSDIVGFAQAELGGAGSSLEAWLGLPLSEDEDGELDYPALTGAELDLAAMQYLNDDGRVLEIIEDTTGATSEADWIEWRRVDVKAMVAARIAGAAHAA